MITTAFQNKFIGRPLVRRLLVGLVATALSFGFTSTEPAAAWQYSASLGSVGSATLPTIYAGDVYQAGVKYFTIYGNAGPVVYRSPASTGTQHVRIKYTVERWNGGWTVLTSSSTMSGQINAGQSWVRFAAPYLLPNVTTGYFRVTYAIDWRNSAGTVVGSTFAVPSVATDHVCGTVNPNRYCQNFGLYVYVG